jgi:hypothetical protein
LFLQIVGDIAALLPPYTLFFLQEKDERVGNCQEMFGKHITCVPLDRNKPVFPDVSNLNDITLMNESVRNGHHSVGDLGSSIVIEANESEQQKFSGKSDTLLLLHHQGLGHMPQMHRSLYAYCATLVPS